MPGINRCCQRCVLAVSALLLVLLAPASPAYAGDSLRRVSQPSSPGKTLAARYRRPALRKVEVAPDTPTLLAVNRVLEPHWRSVRGIDQVVTNLFTVNGKARVQFTGGTAYSAVGALERGSEVNFDDVDMRIYGVSANHIIRLVNRAFKEVEVSRHLEHGTAYSPQVLHLQFKVPRPGRPPMQLDMSLYNNEAAFDSPHQWVSTAKLKLEVPRGGRPSRLFDQLTRLRRGQTIAELRDPSGHGVHDAWDRIIRVTYERGMPPQKQVEGLLHTIYLTGKRPDWTVHSNTVLQFSEMGSRKIRAFFRGHGNREQATIRARYLVNSFKSEPGRTVGASLELGRTTGLWVKLIPSLRSAVTTPASWAKLTELVDAAHRQAMLSGASRGTVFGALLAPLTRAEVEQFLGNTFAIQDADGETFRTDILSSHERHHARWLE